MNFHVKIHVIFKSPDSQKPPIDGLMNYITNAAEDYDSSPSQSNPSTYDSSQSGCNASSGNVINLDKNGGATFLVQIRPMQNQESEQVLANVDSAGSMTSQRYELEGANSQASGMSARSYVLALASDVEDEDDANGKVGLFLA